MSEREAAVELHHMDCLDYLELLAPDEHFDAIVTDPPYGLGFMGKEWDALPPGREWAEACLRALKPGGHLLAFGGTRTWHRLAVAIEDAGFELRDSIAWLYGSGFPKSMDVSKAIDKAARGVPQGGADPTSANHGKYRTTKTEGKRWDGDSGQGYGAGGSRFLADGVVSGSATGPAESGAVGIAPEASQWQGWGTALKPAFEPIVVARKPIRGTVAANVLAHGTGALNIDGCRIGRVEGDRTEYGRGRLLDYAHESVALGKFNQNTPYVPDAAGRWPANVVLDEDQAAALDEQSGGASRFFYVAKASKKERPAVDGVAHPTVKPLALMRWLVRLVTPPGGVVLDPFAGSGTTMEAALLEGLSVVGVEREAGYVRLIEARLNHREGARR